MADGRVVRFRVIARDPITVRTTDADAEPGDVARDRGLVRIAGTRGMNTVTLRTLIRKLGEFWLEARCECGCVTQYPRRYLEHSGLAHVAIGDWAAELTCVHCGGAEPEVLVWNGVIDTGYGSAKPERTVLLERGGGDLMEPSDPLPGFR